MGVTKNAFAQNFVFCKHKSIKLIQLNNNKVQYFYFTSLDRRPRKCLVVQLDLLCCSFADGFFFLLRFSRTLTPLGDRTKSSSCFSSLSATCSCSTVFNISAKFGREHEAGIPPL